nr:L-rhamnonate dehydratase [Klebsiella pneumoniae]
MLNATLYYAGSGGLVMNTISCVDRRCGTCSGKWLACRSTNCWVGRCATKSSSMPPAHVRPGAGDGLYRRQNAYPLGPHDGDAGIRKDVAMVADMREKCGPDFWLMLDCWMSGTLTMPPNLPMPAPLITSSGSKSVCRRSSMKAIAS